MSTTLLQAGALTAHGVRNIARQPFFMAIVAAFSLTLRKCRDDCVMPDDNPASPALSPTCRFD